MSTGNPECAWGPELMEIAMNNQLRPLTLGEILDRAADLYRSRFLLYTGIAAIFAAAILAIQLLYVRSLVALGYPDITAHFQWGTAVAAIVEGLLSLLIYGLSMVAIYRAVTWVYLDQQATITAAVKSVFPRAGRYLWLMTMLGSIAWGPLAVLYGGFLAIAFSVMPHGFLTHPGVVQASPNPTAMMEFGLSALILFPLIIAAVVYGILMSLRYSLSIPSCVAEDLSAWQAIRRSVHLSKGSRGRIFVLALLVGAIRWVLAMMAGVPLLVAMFKHPGQPVPVEWLILTQVANFFINALIVPISAIGLSLFYYDQRIRKEGFDIEWMMQAAGLMTQPAGQEPAGSLLG